jgi:hypothetical protein
MQEQELSVRSIFYTKDQMLWECQKGHATEQDPRLEKNRDYNQLLFPPTSNTSAMLAKWYDEMEKYTRRSLSFPIDRLPAVSGLAEAFEFTGGLEKYVPGLWEEDLLQGLLWSARRQARGREFPIKHRGPSWSRSSIDRSVEWWSRAMVEGWEANPSGTPTIISTTMVPEGSDSYSQILL